MKKFRVYLAEINFGCVDIEAETMEEAEEKALDNLDVIDWYDGRIEVSYAEGHDEKIVVQTGEA